MSYVKKTSQLLDPQAYIASVIMEITGVQLGEKQDALIKSRLSRRFRELGGMNPDEYLQYFLKNREQELGTLISLLTTHHTYFFREFGHFEYLLQSLPETVAKAKKEKRKKIRFWSAACSYGHEVYSLAMFLNTHLPKIDPMMEYEIIGTDVCEDSVLKSRKGIYKWDELKKAPSFYITGNWMKGTGDIAEYVKAGDKMKKNVKFFVNNLQDFSPQIKAEKFDYIFCRNVFIYFTNEQIFKIVTNMKDNLVEGGCLILGLSETLVKLPEKLEHLGRSIYQFDRKAVEEVSAHKSTGIVSKAAPIVQESRLLKVLCVDDSPIVLKILKKILVKEAGFEIVGTAENGIEAHEFLSKNPDIDLMTLDIHMPEMNGVEYLYKHYTPNHPPVVMITSVTRESSGLALKALECGAYDYVEKPSLEEIDLKKEEIIRKLKTAHFEKQLGEKKIETNLERDFSKNFIITESEKKCKVIIGNLPERKKIHHMLRELKAPQPATFLVVDDAQTFSEQLIPEFQGHCDLRVELFKGEFFPNRVYLLDKKDFEKLNADIYEKKAVAMLLSDIGKVHSSWLMKFKDISFITNDTAEGMSSDYNHFYNRAAYKVQYTSFIYESDKILVES